MIDELPLISIVMAIYNPNIKWLKEQLQSLNSQTYANIELRILDDRSNDISFNELQTCVKDCITTFPYYISQNNQNIGSNKTFEKLTLEAKGEYIAYCDQDDLWHSDKLEVLKTQLEKENATLICSDVNIIDEEGRMVSDSITKIRRRHRFYKDHVAQTLLVRNFVIGCTMLINGDLAKCACPFIENMVHDHWLALNAALQGHIAIAKKNLVDYRIHSNNQTLVLAGIQTKEDYITQRIIENINKLKRIEDRLDKIEGLPLTILWNEARLEYAKQNKNSLKKLWSYRYVNLSTTIFEMLFLHMPECVFQIALKLIKYF